MKKSNGTVLILVIFIVTILLMLGTTLSIVTDRESKNSLLIEEKLSDIVAVDGILNVERGKTVPSGTTKKLVYILIDDALTDVKGNSIVMRETITIDSADIVGNSVSGELEIMLDDNNYWELDYLTVTNGTVTRNIIRNESRYISYSFDMDLVVVGSKKVNQFELKLREGAGNSGDRSEYKALLKFYY